METATREVDPNKKQPMVYICGGIIVIPHQIMAEKISNNSSFL